MTKTQIERNLANKDDRIKCSIAKMSNINLTPKQIEDGLKDKNELVREAFASRIDYVPNLEQINRGLNDPCANVRISFIKRKDIRGLLTKNQIEYGLNDEDIRVRQCFSVIDRDIRKRESKEKKGKRTRVRID